MQQPVHPGEWLQITAVAANGEARIYRNGRYIRCDEYDGPTGHGCQAHHERIQPSPGSAPLRLGTRDMASFFQGALSEVRIWNRALSDDEAGELFRTDEAPRDRLAAEFPLDEGSGDIVYDSTGRHRGRIIGARWAER